MSVQSPSFLFDQPKDMIERAVARVEKVIVGKHETISLAMIALLSGGHILLEDVPGVGKTKLAKALSGVIGCTFRRIQFTPDLLPSDITGVSVYSQKTGDFEFRPGPLMAHIVLADELNRTSPRTQAALLEAMEEGKVTVDGATYRLPEPFIVLATQNPLEYEGTYRLPEAQLDRFMMKLHLGYPQPEQEADMLGRLQSAPPVEQLKPVLMREELLALQHETRAVHVEDSLKRYIVAITHATRQHKDIELGASPRASFALLRAAQARAFMMGRTYVVPDDIKQLATVVLAHRLLLKPEAQLSGRRGAAIVEQILSGVAVR